MVQCGVQAGLNVSAESSVLVEGKLSELAISISRTPD